LVAICHSLVRGPEMCGIAGRVTNGGPAGPVAAMVAALHHRGPDSGGAHISGRCALGMRRLKVVDLRPEADQPMTGDRGDIWLVYNGELYNHVELRAELRLLGHEFRSRSDTETIVHGYEEWGEGVVARLRGMFGMAIWDKDRERLLLARDRLGIKPLYLRDEPEQGLAFASEAQAFGPSPVDMSALVSLLRLGWVGAGRTAHVGIRELPPGHLLVYERGRTRLTEYWRPRWRDEPVDPGLVRDAVADSVRRHLEADVPVGIFLSAGVDSAVLAAHAVGRADVRGYTVAFDTGPDESADAQRTARRLGINQTTVRIAGGAVTAALDQVIHAMDQPSVDGVNSYFISHAVREAGVTVALSGLGGDELFSGYSTFHRVPQVLAAGRWAPQSALAAIADIAAASGRTRTSRYARALEGASLGGAPAAYGAVRGLLSWSALHRVWPMTRDLPLADSDLVDVRIGTGVQELEAANYLRYQLLRDTDVMSMTHSLEVRVPLLDDRVVEAALARRPATNGLSGKRLLAWTGGPAVERLARERKRTFTLPFDQWLRGELAGWRRSALESLADSSLGFSSTALQELDAAYENGKLQWRPLWALCILGRWLQNQNDLGVVS